MRKWNEQSLTKNIQRRFSDPLLFVKAERDGRIVVYRVNKENEQKPFKLLDLRSDASRDYILKRLYEMDTWSKTWAKTDLELDRTEQQIERYEQLRKEQALIRKEQDEMTRGARKIVIS